MELTLPQLSAPVALWEKIEVVVKDGDRSGHYLFRVEDFINEGILVSELEFLQGEIRLRENIEVRVVFTREDAIYEGWSKIRRYRDPRGDLFLLARPKNMQRVQRRQHVRVEIAIKVAFAIITSAKKQVEGVAPLDWHRAITHDISAGGLLMISDQEVAPKDFVLLKMDFLDKIALPKTIVAYTRRVVPDDDKFMVGVEFVRAETAHRFAGSEDLMKMYKSIRQFSGRAQDRLVNFVFQQQIELRKKGLL